MCCCDDLRVINYRRYLQCNSKIHGIGSDPQRTKAALSQSGFNGVVIWDTVMRNVLPVYAATTCTVQLESQEVASET